MSKDPKILELEKKSLIYREKILRYIRMANAGHTGGSLSAVDILNVLYNRVMNVNPGNIHSPDRDRYIQSKGHCVEALFVVLADCGFFPEKDLETMSIYQSHYVGHPTRKVNGVEQNTGALGHGLPMAVGTALAAKKDDMNYKVYTLLGDGEIAEGSNWEGAMAAAHYNLDNLFAIVDHNTLQITGHTHEVCANGPLDKKFEAFGWATVTVDGHDLEALIKALEKPLVPGKPTAVIANTIKGKGISYIEHQKKWHHKVPTAEEYELAKAEIDQQLASYEGKF